MSAKSSDSYAIGFLSFISILFWAIVQVLTVFKINVGVLSWISTLTMLIALFWSAWLFVAHKSKNWKIIYLVVLIFAILGFVWGNHWFVFWEK